MTTRTAAKVIASPPRRRARKILFSIFLGVLLGAAVVLFLSRVHNPFEEGIGDRDLLLLAPDDADALVFVPKVAKFLGEVRDRPFIRGLADHPPFQSFLRSDYARRTGALETLSAAFRELDLLRARPPLGLDLFGDILGDALVVAGYAPAQPGRDWQFMAMFRPNDWKVLAGVNVLVDDVIGDLGPVRNALEGAGVQHVERHRDSITLHFRQGPAISLARIRNVVVAGTEIDRITRLKTTIERDRLPASPPFRYAGLSPDLGASPYEVRAVVRRKVADAQLQLSARLDAEWGRDNVSLLEATIPRFGGEDVVVTLALDDVLDLRLRIVEAAPRQHDLSQSLRNYPREDAAMAFQRAAPLLPDSTFAFTHFRADVPRFLDAFFQRSELFSAADINNLKDALKSVPGVDDLAGLKNKLAQISDGRISIGFFTQDREPLDKAAPGHFVAWQLQDETELRNLISAVDRQIRERSSQGVKSVVREIVHTAGKGVDVYELVLPEGVVDDARVTKLGLVIGRGVLIVTNYVPSFRGLAQVGALDERTLPAESTLITTLDRGPDSMRIDGAIAGAPIYRYFDHAAVGWAVQKTTPSARKEIEWRATAEASARQRGLKDGTPEFNKVVDESYQRNLDSLLQIERPRISREIAQNLEYFRGLVSGVGFSIGERDGVEIGVRVELMPRVP
jgi:hypothetical protein